MAVVALARDNDLPLSVYGGGHGVTGSAVVDGGVCLDLRGMRAVTVDAGAQTAVVQGGATWGEVDAACQEHGLAVTGGRVSGTGVVGLALGSGSGWLERAFGLVCDNLLAATVVTADGRVVTASEQSEPELFWGLRGGGGNFGVVTDMTLRLHPLGPIVYGGMLLYPAQVAGELVRAYRDFIAAAPDEVGSGLAFITAPPEEFVPEPARGQPAIGIVCCYAGPAADGPNAYRALRELPYLGVDLLGEMPYVAVQQLLDPPNQKGAQNYWTADFLAELPDEAIDTLVGQGHPTRVAADADHPHPRWRGAVPRRRGRHGLRPAPGAVEPAPPLDVARSGRHRDQHRLHPRPRDGDEAVDDRSRLPQLHRRRGRRARRGRLRPGEVRPPQPAQAGLGPHQPVPPQPEHRPGAGRLAAGLSGDGSRGSIAGRGGRMASYTVNKAAVDHVRELIDKKQYVLDSDWGDSQPGAEAQNAYLERHGWDDYAAWHLGLTEGASDETKARYAFVCGDFRRVHRSGLIACVYRASEWRHKQVELAAHHLLQHLDEVSG